MVPVAEPIAPPAVTVSPAIPQDSVSLPQTEPGAALTTPIIQTNHSSPVSDPKKSVDVLGIFSWVWLGGCLLMLGYGALSYWRLRRTLCTAVREDAGIWRSESVVSPFVLGFFRPRIYLPFAMEELQAKLVIAHEKAHIRRKDHWWKPLGFLLLSIHWFNPVLWLAYILLCRDIEFACDEKVIRDMEPAVRADYSQALLTCAVHRRRISACPLAFGESGVGGRIKSVLRYKKPAFWFLILALIAGIAVAVCFLTDPKEPKAPLSPPLSEIHNSYTLEQAKKDGCLVMEDSKVTSGKQTFTEFVNRERDAIRIVSYYTLGDPSRYDPAYFETVKDDYPMLFVHDLSFDGEVYIWQSYENGKLQTETYRYLKEDIEPARTEDADYDYCHRYLLVDDPDVTWDEVFQGLISSWYPTPTPRHASVYTDYVRLPQSAGSQDASHNTPGYSPVQTSPVTVWEDFAGEYSLPELPGVKLYRSEDGYSIIRQDSSGKEVLHTGMPILNGYFKDLTGDGVPELCLTSLFGSGVVDSYVSIYDLKAGLSYELRDRMVTDYRLTAEDGMLLVEMCPYATSYREGAEGCFKGELALVGSAYGDGLHPGIWMGNIPIVNTPDEADQKSAIQSKIHEQYANEAQGQFTLNHLTILDTADWGDPVYKDGVVDRTTVYGVFRYASYNIREGKAVCLFEKEGTLTATVRLSATGRVYVTEFEGTVPQTYAAQAEPALEALRKEAEEEARKNLEDMLSIHHPWGKDLAMKQIEFDPVQGSMEFIWDQDPAKAPIEYARENFAYLWEELPLCEIPNDYTVPLELFLNTSYSEDTPGNPQGRWKLYREDGTIVSRSQEGSLPHTDTRVISVALPAQAGTYILEVTVFWEDFDTYMRYGLTLVIA